MGSSKVEVTIFLARHGECSGNLAQTFLDPFTDNLTPVGQAQATLLGKHLKDVPFTVAFASDYLRAEETARAVLRESSTACKNGVELKTDKRLREMDLTGLMGVHAKDAVCLMHNIMQKGTPFLKAELENCEKVEQFEARIVSFYKELIERMQKSTRESRDHETVLIVSHGLTIQRTMILLNSQPQRFGISKWASSRISERQMRNTTYHKLRLDIPKGQNDGDSGVTGFVESAHCRDHVQTNGSSVDQPSNNEQVSVKDTGNYTFLDQVNEQGSTFEEETVHYCKPV